MSTTPGNPATILSPTTYFTDQPETLSPGELPGSAIDTAPPPPSTETTKQHTPTIILPPRRQLPRTSNFQNQSVASIRIPAPTRQERPENTVRLLLEEANSDNQSSDMEEYRTPEQANPTQIPDAQLTENNDDEAKGLDIDTTDRIHLVSTESTKKSLFRNPLFWFFLCAIGGGALIVALFFSLWADSDALPEIDFTDDEDALSGNMTMSASPVAQVVNTTNITMASFVASASPIIGDLLDSLSSSLSATSSASSSITPSITSSATSSQTGSSSSSMTQSRTPSATSTPSPSREPARMRFIDVTGETIEISFDSLEFPFLESHSFTIEAEDSTTLGTLQIILGSELLNDEVFDNMPIDEMTRIAHDTYTQTDEDVNLEQSAHDVPVYIPTPTHNSTTVCTIIKMLLTSGGTETVTWNVCAVAP